MEMWKWYGDGKRNNLREEENIVRRPRENHMTLSRVLLLIIFSLFGKCLSGIVFLRSSETDVRSEGGVESSKSPLVNLYPVGVW